MIVTIVRFPPMSEPLSVDQARQAFAQTAPRYLDKPGLLWKAYLRADDERTVGGVYWWVDRASAEAVYTSEWFAGVTAKYGGEPTVEWFDTPVVVDRRFSMIRTEAPLESVNPDLAGR